MTYRRSIESERDLLVARSNQFSIVVTCVLHVVFDNSDLFSTCENLFDHMLQYARLFRPSDPYSRSLFHHVHAFHDEHLDSFSGLQRCAPNYFSPVIDVPTHIQKIPFELHEISQVCHIHTRKQVQFHHEIIELEVASQCPCASYDSEPKEKSGCHLHSHMKGTCSCLYSMVRQSVCIK